MDPIYCKKCNHTVESVPVHTIPGGPIEMSGYDHFGLVVDHLAVLPDGRTMHIPAGTKLIMDKGGGGPGIRYENGAASKGCPGDYPAAPSA